jgi:hypothetical protein
MINLESPKRFDAELTGFLGTACPPARRRP